jgi:hypothetical protein
VSHVLAGAPGCWLLDRRTLSPMTKTPSARERLGYVDESDLDLAIVLDANRNGPILQLLLRSAGLSPTGDVTASRSTLRCGGTRETDVEVTWTGGALLVEDKVDAAFTPGQPESYRTEVEDRRSAGQSAAAILVCPQRNRARYETAAGDAFIYVTCEDLAAAAEANGDLLSAALALVLHAAAEPPPGPISDPVAMAWGEGYRAVVHAVTPPGERVVLAKTIVKAGENPWVKLGLVPSLPGGTDGPWHWLGADAVCLYVPTEPDLTVLPPGWAVARTRKSWRIDASVPTVGLDRPAAEQSDSIRRVVREALLLGQWWRDHGRFTQA